MSSWIDDFVYRVKCNLAHSLILDDAFHSPDAQIPVELDVSRTRAAEWRGWGSYLLGSLTGQLVAAHLPTLRHSAFVSIHSLLWLGSYRCESVFSGG